MVPNPLILAGATPPGGLLLVVTDQPGDLAGYQLLGLTGPECTIELTTDGETWIQVTYPHTLAPCGLRLIRTDTSPFATSILALAPTV